MGFWIRFYTLDGFAPSEDLGWSAGYNFGSREAAAIRWKAAIEAGVNLIATDQYEDLAALMREFRVSSETIRPSQTASISCSLLTTWLRFSIR